MSLAQRMALSAGSGVEHHRMFTKIHGLDCCDPVPEASEIRTDPELLPVSFTRAAARTASSPGKPVTPSPTPSHMSTPTFARKESEIIDSGYYNLHACNANGSTDWGSLTDDSDTKSLTEVLQHCRQSLYRRQHGESEATLD